MQVNSHEWPRTHELISNLSVGGIDRADITDPATAALFDVLESEGMLEERDDVPAGGAEVTFVGHNTVVIRDGDTAIVVDPFFAPTSPGYPQGYQPTGLADIGPLDAVFITHSHRDHFHPASLLRIPSSTTVFVPAVERESVLTIDMAHRLRELGFTDVRTLQWDDCVRVGSIEVRAMPFYGEQPSDGPRLHPEVRNEGCTYRVTTAEWSCVLLADSGSDQDGDSRNLATENRRRYGPVDVVFSGYRGWATYPPQLLGSSVARFLLFVPHDQWSVLSRLMNSVDDAIDVAERWGARYLCPYGDGGAPWYWLRGLGPRLDGSGRENADFDPYPERVITAAANRSAAVDGRPIPTSVEVLLLRPGQSVDGIAGSPRRSGPRWPYGAGEDVPC